MSTCEACGRERPEYEIKSFGAALRAHAEDKCWLDADKCRVTPFPRVFLDGQPLPEPSKIIRNYAITAVCPKDGKIKAAMFGSDGKVLYLKEPPVITNLSLAVRMIETFLGLRLLQTRVMEADKMIVYSVMSPFDVELFEITLRNDERTGWGIGGLGQTLSIQTIQLGIFGR